MIPYKAILLLVVGVVFFARGAKVDGKSPLLWGLLSAAAWFATYFAFGAGLGKLALGQIALYVGLFAWALYRERKPKAGGGAA